LNIEFRRDTKRGTLTLHQGKYIDDMLRAFNFENLAPSHTCSTSVAAKPKPSDPPDDSSQLAALEKCTPYGRLVGMLQHAARSTRPGISYSTSQLAQRQDCPRIIDYKAAIRVLRYLKGTRDTCLTYSRPHRHSNTLLAYSDASWADSRKSVSGYTILMNGASVMWRSHLQTIIALSSTEAEYVSAAEATKEIITIRRFLSELGYAPQLPTPILVDNTACVQLAKDGDAQHRTKHIDIKYHYIHHAVDEHLLTIHHIPRKDQVADVLTKSSTRAELTKFRLLLLGQ
jgi:hypothetical protein